MSLSKSYKPKLIVLLSRFPFPLEKGDKLRAYYQLIDLSKEFEIHLICISDFDIPKQYKDEIGKFCKKIYIYKLKKRIIVFNLMKTLLSKTPFQVSYFYQNWIKNEIQKNILEIKPDAIYCQLIRTSEYVKNYHNCPKTIDLMDALSKGMERRAKKKAFYSAWIFREESLRLKKYESKIIDYFENYIIISSQDKGYIFHPKNAEIIVIPNGVGQAFLNYSIAKEKEFDLIFTGNMNYPPNIEAAHYIVEKILPKLKLIYPNIKIGIIGANPSKILLKLESKNVHISGWVDDIKAYYAKSEIFIAPMFSGTGMQNKIIESMAIGIPCITNNLANNAILAKHNKEIIIAESLEEILNAISDLKNDSSYYANISNNAKKFVTENYNWETVNRNLINCIKRQLN